MNKILNFGSLNLDYTYNVGHFVKAGETLSANALTVNCGGKGLNQSIAAARAGAKVFHAGKIGKDGVILKELLEKNGVNTDNVLLSGGANGHAIIQVSKDGQNCILLYPGANREITEAEVDAVLSRFDRDDLIILQNEINNIPYLMTEAYKKGLKIVFNPSPITDELYGYPIEKAFLLVLNEIEGAALVGTADPDEALKKLREKYPDTEILLTLGENGSVYYGMGGATRQKAYPASVVDTTGAGDAMLGYFVASLIKGLTPADALRRASAAAAITVSRRGAAASIPSADEVDGDEGA